MFRALLFLPLVLLLLLLMLLQQSPLIALLQQMRVVHCVSMVTNYRIVSKTCFHHQYSLLLVDFIPVDVRDLLRTSLFTESLYNTGQLSKFGGVHSGVLQEKHGSSQDMTPLHTVLLLPERLGIEDDYNCVLFERTIEEMVPSSPPLGSLCYHNHR